MVPVGVAQLARHLHLTRQDAYQNRCGQYSPENLPPTVFGLVEVSRDLGLLTPAKANLVTKVVSYLPQNKKLCSKERKSQKGLCGEHGLLWERASRPLPPHGAKRSIDQ